MVNSCHFNRLKCSKHANCRVLQRAKICIKGVTKMKVIKKANMIGHTIKSCGVGCGIGTSDQE